MRVGAAFQHLCCCISMSMTSLNHDAKLGIIFELTKF